MAVKLESLLGYEIKQQYLLLHKAHVNNKQTIGIIRNLHKHQLPTYIPKMIIKNQNSARSTVHKGNNELRMH